MLLQIFGSFLAVVAFCFLLGSPRHHMFWAGLTGAFGWALYLVLGDLGFSIGTATFFSGCLISFFSQILARVLKAPVTMFVIPGILPLVPGEGMYRIVSSIIHSDGSSTSYYMKQTLIVAGMIALSIIVLDSFFALFLKNKGDYHVDC